MELCIDIGNSRTKLAFFKRDQLLEYHVAVNSEILKLKQIVQNSSFSTVKLCTVSQENSEFVQFLQEYTNLYIVTSRSKFPIQLDYETPHTLGLDRIMAAVGAFKLFPEQDCLIINAGTCITIDFLDAKAYFRGGNISPGLRMRARSMNEFTAKLPFVEVKDETDQEQLFGRSTNQALIKGIKNGVLYEIEAYYNHLQEKYPSINVVITGGDGEYLVNRLTFKTFAEPYLVLKGINQLQLDT